MHCVGSALIASKATPWQKKEYLEPIAIGEHITTLALSESGTGAHFYFPQTPLMALTENEFVVSGVKTFVTNGSHADSYVVSTLGASAEAESDQFSCILLNADSKGIEWGKPWDGLGMRGNSSRALKLNNVHLLANHILGEKGDQLWYVFNVIAPNFLIAMSGTYVGIAESALNQARESLSSRIYVHNGSSLAQLSILQHRLGIIWARVESARRLIYHAAECFDQQGSDYMLKVFSAKAEVASCCVDVVNEAMTLTGGLGYQSNSYLGMLLRDARAAHVMSPTTDLLYIWMGRLLLDQLLFSD